MKREKNISTKETDGTDQLLKRLLLLEGRVKVLESEIASLREPHEDEGICNKAYIRELARLTAGGDNRALHEHNRRMEAIYKARGDKG